VRITIRSKEVVVDAVGRCSERILRATVQVVDVNGPRGGNDKVCRAARAIARSLERARDREREVAPAGTAIESPHRRPAA